MQKSVRALDPRELSLFRITTTQCFATRRIHLHGSAGFVNTELSSPDFETGLPRHELCLATSKELYLSRKQVFLYLIHFSKMFPSTVFSLLVAVTAVVASPALSNSTFTQR